MQSDNPRPINSKVRIHKPLTSPYLDVDPILLVSAELKYVWGLCQSSMSMDVFRKKCRLMFQKEGRDYSVQKFGNNLVMMCKVCKKNVLVSFDAPTPQMKIEVFGQSHADEVKWKKHYTHVNEVCEGAKTEVPLSRTEKECDVARMLQVNDTHHTRNVIKEVLIDVDVSDYVLALANCNKGITMRLRRQGLVSLGSQ